MKDRSTGLIRHRKTDLHNIRVENVNEPNLQRAVFPYEEIPRIDFDNVLLTVSPAEELFITDTTFRDGQQSRPPYTVRQIVDLYTLLHRLGGPNGVIRQCEFFLYSQKDKRAVEECLALDFRYPEVTGWIRAREEDFKLAKDLGLKETGILTSVSDYHIFLKLKKNRKRVIQDYLTIVNKALEEGVRPRCHFEDITRSDIYGFTVPLAVELMKLREESGVDIKIRLCDTLGYGVPYPTAALPRSVPKLVRTIIDEAGVPGHLLEWHGHNDFHKVLINASTAWLYGCAAANGTVCGFGERTGNTPIEGLIVEYISLMGDVNGVDTTVITEIANYLGNEVGVQIPKNYPLIGANFNATSAGVHIDGIAKNEEIYNIFNTEKILNRPMGIIINDKSGAAGVAHWINNHLRLTEDRRISKRHPGVAKINTWVKSLFEEGRVAGISDEEMERVARRFVPAYFISEFDRIKARANHFAEEIMAELISHEELKTMNTKKIEPPLQQLVANNPFIKFAYVCNMEGKIITRILTQVEDKAIYEHASIDGAQRLAEIDFRERPWFRGTVTDGQIHVTDLYTSWITHRLSITVSGPINGKSGEILGVLVLDINFDDLVKVEEEEIIHEQEQSAD